MSEPSAGTGQAGINEWLNTAHRVVLMVHPDTDFATDTPEVMEAQRALEYCLYEHFCVPGSFMDLEGVRLAWRSYYNLCKPF